jgi:hypothetical protein
LGQLGTTRYDAVTDAVLADRVRHPRAVA